MREARARVAGQPSGEVSTERIARCHCGQFSVRTVGEPVRVAQCHCRDCQRRTGSSYNLGAVFEASDVELLGEYRTYRRSGDSGLEIEFHFCPQCGSNVHWIYGEVHVVAAGCYADPGFVGGRGSDLEDPQ